MSSGPELSQVFLEIHQRYRQLDSTVIGGFSPHVAPLSHNEGNFILKNGVVLSSSGSIADSEMAIVHGLCETQRPKKILVIGNSYGLSTLFLALSNPGARVVAIDKFRVSGIEFTRNLCEGLSVSVIQASTPDDLREVIDAELGGIVDFVFVDAVHENEVQTREFEILEPVLASRGTVLFHDVLGCNLLASVSELSERFSEIEFRVLTKSLSGLAVAVKGASPEVLAYLDYFSTSPSTVLGLETLLASQWGEVKSEFFHLESTLETLKFPPHPQL